jgi:hypothetical protein
MKIKLQKAFDLLSGAAAVIIKSEDVEPLVYANISELTGDKTNEFLFLCWESPEFSEEFSTRFIEENNQEVLISDCGNNLVLEDAEGDVVTLKLLFPSQLSSFCQEGDIA